MKKNELKIDSTLLSLRLLGKIATDSKESKQSRAKELFKYGFNTSEVALALGLSSSVASTFKGRVNKKRKGKHGKK